MGTAPNSKDPELEVLLIEEELIDVQGQINELTTKKLELSLKRDEHVELIRLAKKYNYRFNVREA